MSMFHELMMKKKGMPSRYQEVEYIESTGTQYIDTGISKETNINCEMVVQSNNNLANKIIFGAESSGGQWIGTSGAYYSLGGGVDFSFSSTSKQTINFNIKYHDSISATIDAETKSRNFVSQGGQSANNYIIFGVGSALLSSCKIYSCIIKRENNSVLRNFIPVYDTLTQKYGIWETVQGKFYGNDGTGDFGGSIVGYTIVGSPTITDGVVSGFSASDYIQTSQSLSTISSVEEVLSITTGLSVSSEQWLITSGGFSTAIYSSGKIVVYYAGGYTFSTISLQPNTQYKLKLVYSNQILSFYIDDNLQFSKEVSTGSLANKIKFGSNANASFFQGNINLNETYIKKDGKLWFNGQQA